MTQYFSLTILEDLEFQDTQGDVEFVGTSPKSPQYTDVDNAKTK